MTTIMAITIKYLTQEIDFRIAKTIRKKARLNNKDCIPEIDFQRCRDRISMRLNNDDEIDLKDFNKRLI